MLIGNFRILSDLKNILAELLILWSGLSLHYFCYRMSCSIVKLICGLFLEAPVDIFYESMNLTAIALPFNVL